MLTEPGLSLRLPAKVLAVDAGVLYDKREGRLYSGWQKGNIVCVWLGVRYAKSKKKSVVYHNHSSHSGCGNLSGTGIVFHKAFLF